LAGLKKLPSNTENHLETPKDIAAYLESVFEDGDQELITYALGAVARSKGMTEIARKTKLGRQDLYQALSPDTPAPMKAATSDLDSGRRRAMAAARP
jgi:probable addiction module antidote protein